MNSDDFRNFAKAATDYIADYLDNIRKRQPVSSVQPGYLQNSIPKDTPQKGETWESILQDVDRIIIPGLTHWHSPNFHAYYPTANSYPGIVGELLLSGLGVLSTESFSDPVCDSLELKMLDWLTKLLNLPRHFLNNSDGPGGGLIQNAASESTLIALLAAKNQKINLKIPERKLVAYTSKQCNSSVEKAGILASIPMRLLPTDGNGSLRGITLLKVIQDDVEAGLTPCCVIATLGTTGTCAFDCLNELGPICRQFDVWLHVDAAYAGAAFCCPEYRFLMKGVHFADSFCVNPHKWLLVNSDCSALWVRNTTHVERLFNKKGEGLSCSQIPDVRRFRALKLWFVMRIYGVEGVRNHIRKQVKLAEYFSELVQSDDRFELCSVNLGLVCFRLKGENAFTEILLDKLEHRKLVFVMPYFFDEKLMIRLVICSRFTEENDVLYTWNEIKSQITYLEVKKRTPAS